MTASRYMNFKNLLLAATILPGSLILTAPSPATAQTQAVASCQAAPPILPVYAQPPMPEAGYIWTPGYWASAETTGYSWVPGTWVLPPIVGVLWTPPYWGWNDGAFTFHGGYWGPHVGYYGGVNYGYGYGGVGFEGGRWEGGRFAYNRSVNNFGSVHVTNAYQQAVTPGNDSHVSYAGGAGGIKSEPTAAERVAERENHLPATPEQAARGIAAAGHPGPAASDDNGRPAIAASARPRQFEGAGMVRPAPEPARATMAHAAVGRPIQRQPAYQAAHPVSTRAAEPRAAVHRAEPRAVMARAAPAHDERGHVR